MIRSGVCNYATGQATRTDEMSVLSSVRSTVRWTLGCQPALCNQRWETAPETDEG